MDRFSLAALALLALTACNPPTPDTPPTAQIEVTTNSKVQNVLNVSVTVTGDNLRQVTLLRDSSNDQIENYQVIKQVNTAPFSFSFDDTVPGNGKYLYRVVVLAGAYRTVTDRQVTYTYTVGQTRP